MANIDTEHLNTLVTRFKAFNKPTDAQQLIITLGDKQERTEDDDKKLIILLRAEKKAEELVQARAKARKMLDNVKSEERKKQTRNKIIWGAALKTAAQTDPQIAKLAIFLFNEGFVAEKDKDAVRSDFEALTASLND